MARAVERVRMGRWAAGLWAAAMLLLLFPPTSADHCETGIAVYGRGPLTPGVVAPVTPASQICFEVETTATSGHTFPPLTNQITVRMERNLGASYPQIQLRLDGLGWHNQIFWLERTQWLGSTYYSLPDWLDIPDPARPDPTLRATVRYPGGHEETAEYVMGKLPLP